MAISYLFQIVIFRCKIFENFSSKKSFHHRYLVFGLEILEIHAMGIKAFKAFSKIIKFRICHVLKTSSKESS